MPSQEVSQPQSQQMQLPTQDGARIGSEQPKPVEQMTAEPVSMRGGGEGGDICCGICAGLACFECCECCC